VCSSKNEIVSLIFGDNKWETELGKKVHPTLVEYGREVRNSKELKANMILYIEAVAVLKAMENESAV